jgi:hypothetical protein
MAHGHLAIAGLAAVAVLAAAGCSSIGLHDHAALAMIDAGPPVTLAVCALLDDGITADEAAALVDHAWREEGPRVGIRVRLARATPWKRPAFTADGLMRAIRRERLEPPCDRIVAFVGRHVGDLVWGLLLPEALGGAGLVHGYVVARRASLGQLLASPAAVLRHELYHLLGCEHALSMAGCYVRIAALRRDHRGEFFPVWSRTLSRAVASREEVTRLLHGWRGSPAA